MAIRRGTRRRSLIGLVALTLGLAGTGVAMSALPASAAGDGPITGTAT